MQPDITILESQPHRHIVRRVIVIISALVIIAGITLLVINHIHQINLENDVKTELIKQDTILRSSGVSGIYRQTLPAAIKSTSKVHIVTLVSVEGTSYCIAATSTKDAKVVYHMNENTPIDTPTAGSCTDKVTILPSVPGAVSVASTAAKDITLQWRSSTYATGYTVQCATNESFTDGLKLQSTSDQSATVKGLSDNTVYYCRVAATNTVGQSAWSLVIQAKTHLYAQSPMHMKADIVSSSELSYSWDVVPKAQYYILQYTTDINFVKDVTQIRVDGTSGSITGLKTYTGYFFRAEAVTADFDATHAAFSDPAFARTKQ